MTPLLGRLTEGREGENAEASQVVRAYAEVADNPDMHDASSKRVVTWSVEREDAVKHVGMLVDRLNRVLADLTSVRPHGGAAEPVRHGE